MSNRRKCEAGPERTQESKRMISNGEIEATVNGFVDAFFRDARGETVPVETVLLESESAQKGEGAKKPLDPLSIRHERGGLICTLDLAGLAEVPEAALYGWVDITLAKALMERESQRYHQAHFLFFHMKRRKL